MMRYALYFTPAPSSPWHAAGAQWLGRDAVSGAPCTQRAISGVSPELFARLTSDARRYGFHATLKAPFRLADDASEQQLLDMVAGFCASQHPITLSAPHVGRHRDFLALLIDDADGNVPALAMRCVSHFDGLRAALTPEEMARRRRDKLTPRQEALLQRWGYPYTEEQFRFHMTLSGALSAVDADVAAQLRRSAQDHFTAVAAHVPLALDGLTVMREEVPGAPFRVWQRCSFGQMNGVDVAARQSAHCD